jgi:hypothetical protein
MQLAVYLAKLAMYFRTLVVYLTGPFRYRTRLGRYLARLTMPQSSIATPFVTPNDVLALLEGVRATLVVSQRELAEICGLERRSVMKWQQGRGQPMTWHWESMAKAVYPRNAPLAAQLAAAGGTTLSALGLQASATAAEAPQGAQTQAVSATHLVDSVVCAAAETMQVPPHTIRPALVAAFQRSIALGLGTSAVLAGLTPPAPPATPKKG